VNIDNFAKDNCEIIPEIAIFLNGRILSLTWLMSPLRDQAHSCNVTDATIIEKSTLGV
jgi:hypothetical protein